MPPAILPDSGAFRFQIATMGCKANATDTHVLADRLQALGGIAVPEESGEAVDVFIVNSCTVTDRADRDALTALKQGKAPLKVFTGCLAEVDPEILAQGNLGQGKTLLARNSAKPELAQNIVAALRAENIAPLAGAATLAGDRVRWHREIDFAAGAVVRASTRTRAFLKVQDGCNQFCSYCIIPRARGRSRSLSVDSVVAEVEALAQAGVGEVVLTAIHAADYEDKGQSFFNLVERVLQETQVARLRLTSLDPAEISSELIQLMAKEPRLCQHFHVSLQSGSSAVLREMRRHYDAARAEACLQEIARVLPQAFVGMDMIAGFPTETLAEHEETLALLKRTPFTRLHVFPFSERRSTRAAELSKSGIRVPEPEKRRRAAELRALSEERMRAALSARVGRVMEVLVEAKSAEILGQPAQLGHARSYFRVAVPAGYAPGTKLPVRITGMVPERELLTSLPL